MGVLTGFAAAFDATLVDGRSPLLACGAATGPHASVEASVAAVLIGAETDVA
jgi:hypothetical protein